ncbi:MAG: dipeptide epimerase [Sumerlaeia bacterium]
MRHTIRPLDLKLRHPFGISRGTSTEVPVFLLELEGGGLGEGSAVRYKGENIEESRAKASQLAESLSEQELFDLQHVMRRAKDMTPKNSAARTAFDLAIHDRIGKQLGIPLYKLFGLPPARGAASSITIGLDTDEKMAEKAREQAHVPILKVKLGRDDADRDIATLKAVREAAPNVKNLSVDANAGWSLDTAIQCAKAFADMGVSFLEQPLAIGNLEELGKLKRQSPLPIIADEDAQDSASLPALLGKVDGINIKLMKCGGLWDARKMIAFAEAVGWRIMLGCMIETGVGIAAASHLAGAAEVYDLDSELLIANNPIAPSVLNSDGLLTTPDGPGLGVGIAG